MIRKLLATTAIVILASGGAYAQAVPPVETAPQTALVIHATGHLASSLIGESVYNGPGEDAHNIGKVSDLVISDADTVEAIVVAVGGFLGIGQKEVALEYGLVKWAAQSDGTLRLTIDATKESLEKLPEFDRSAYKPMPADASVNVVAPADSEALNRANAEALDGQAPASTNTATPGETTTVPPVTVTQDRLTVTDDVIVDRSALVNVDPAQLSVDKLIGATVYGAADEKVGKVGDVVLDTGGKAETLVLDVGGFLGIGSKPVAIAMENLQFLADGDGDYYLYTPFTKETLEAQPEYSADAYATDRDRLLLRLP